MTGSRCISLNSFTLEYFVSGSGNQTTIALHGFGRDASDFDSLPNYLKDHKIYAFNLFFHGKSIFPENRIEKQPISKKELKELMEIFFEKEEINSFHIVAYSIGGRFALLLTELFKDKIASLTLFAPDGLVQHPLYVFSCKTVLGNILFKRFTFHPKVIDICVSIFHKLGLIDERLVKFYKIHYGNEASRVLVYKAWMALRRLHPDLKQVSRNIEQNEIKTLLVFGKYDRIIPISNGKNLGKNKLIETLILESGHELLTEKNFTLVFGRKLGIAT